MQREVYYPSFFLLCTYIFMNNLSLLTISRLFAALFVVFFHFSHDIDFLKNTFWQNGNISVSYFFSLSGFILLYSAWSKKENKTFGLASYYVGRFARIYPLFFLSLIAVFIIHLLWKMPDANLPQFLMCALGLQAFFPEQALSLNYPAWSLSVEFFFYALFPFFFSLAYKSSLRTFSIVSIGLYLLTQLWLLVPSLGFSILTTPFTHDGALHFLYYFPLWHLSTFLIGMLGARLFLLSAHLPIKKYELPLLVLSLVSLVAILLTHGEIFIHDGLLAPLFVFIICLLARFSIAYTPGKIGKGLELLGEASYGVYILQLPVHLSLTVLSSLLLHIPDPLATFG